MDNWGYFTLMGVIFTPCITGSGAHRLENKSEIRLDAIYQGGWAQEIARKWWSTSGSVNRWGEGEFLQLPPLQGELSGVK